MTVESGESVSVEIAKLQLQRVATTVWTHPEWPPEHRPDVAFLQERINIVDGPSQGMTPHADIKPDLRLKMESLIAQQVVTNHEAWLAHYDPDQREIYVKPNFLDLPPVYARRTIVHEAATDLVAQTRVVAPAEYSDFQRRNVQSALEYFFDDDRRPDFTDTHIRKCGYRETVMVGDGILGDIALLPELVAIDEIYPTIIEILSEYAFQLDGDVSALDRLLREGKLPVQRYESHPAFASELLALFQKIDWKLVLNAFSTGDLQRTIEILNQYGNGVKTVLRLALSISQNEVPLDPEAVIMFDQSL